MRRVLIPAVLAVGLAGLGPGPALAQAPAPTPAAGAPAVPGKKVCTVADDRLVEMSGLVATADGYIVVNDSTDVASRERIFFLGKKCGVRETQSYTGNGPRDAEDLALSRDGKTLWIADIGDNGANRETIALWRMPADGSEEPELARLRYPEGVRRDAEALLVGADGIPTIITKGAKAELYRPAAAPRDGQTTPMAKAGEVTLPRTTTGNPLGAVGRTLVTGAATSPDGSRVVLRTYADAFEWDVKGGDIVAALTSGEPRITPLPDEPWGESISYSPDGKAFLTVSETAQQEGLEAEILRYTPAKAAPKPVAGAAASAGASGDDTRSFFDKLDLGDITLLIGGVGLLGVLLVAAGVIGIVLARRRNAGAAAGPALTTGLPVRGAAARPPEDATDILARMDGPRGYGRGAARDGGGTYGSGGYGEDREPTSGAVYGGARAGGPAGRPPATVYGAGAGYAGDRDGGPDRTDGLDRTGGAVYGGGYRSGRDADRYPQQDRGGPPRERGGQYRSGGVYGGGSTGDPGGSHGDGFDGGPPVARGGRYAGGRPAGQGRTDADHRPAGHDDARYDDARYDDAGYEYGDRDRRGRY